MKLKQLEKSGILAVKLLRRTKLNLGHPFMINTNALPTDQCYLEYPNGSITLVTISRKNNDFKIIEKLTPQQCDSLRKKYKLI
jgi:hypothetical protein